MTHGQALKAYTTIIGLRKRAKERTAYFLFRLKEELKPLVDFQAEEEMKLIEKYDGKVNEMGFVMIEDDEKREAFLKEKEELARMVIDPEITPVKINPEKIADINIEEIEALSGFVNFE